MPTTIMGIPYMLEENEFTIMTFDMIKSATAFWQREYLVVRNGTEYYRATVNHLSPTQIHITQPRLADITF